MFPNQGGYGSGGGGNRQWREPGRGGRGNSHSGTGSNHRQKLNDYSKIKRSANVRRNPQPESLDSFNFRLRQQQQQQEEDSYEGNNTVPEWRRGNSHSGSGSNHRQRFNGYSERSNDFRHNQHPDSPDNFNFRLRQQQQQQGEDSNQRNTTKFEGPVFGFKRLFGFLTSEDDHVIVNIHRDLKEWEILLDQDTIATVKTLRNESQEMSDDILVLLVSILGEKIVSDSTVLSSKQVSIITSSATSGKFLSKVDEKCKRYMMQEEDVPRNFRRRNPNNHAVDNEMEVDQSRLRWFRNLHKLFHFVATKMQATAVDFLSKLIPSTLGTLAYLQSGDSSSEELAKLLKDFQDLKKTLDSIKKDVDKKNQDEEKAKSRRKYDLTPDEEQELHAQLPPDDYKDISIIPSIDELKSCEPTFLRTNKVRGSYLNTDHYLDVQFRLLREDFVRPLKLGIQDYMKNKLDYLSKKKRPPIGNVRVYHEVHITKMELVRGTMVQYVQLHPSSYTRVKWEKSKRLLNGSLLLFTPDDFSSAFFAIVHSRDERDLKQGIFGVTWEGPLPDTSNKDDTYLLVESENYFEAYKHTLKILKEIELENFPMSKFIVEASPDVRPPSYLLENRNLMKIGQYECSPLLNGTWPTADQLKLDEKQYEAFKACLCREFAIVQGPPGTGKTFLALQIVEVFLRNLSIWNSDGGDSGPILIVCYTNHALDSFLEGILEVFKRIGVKPSMIRVGGRSKTEALDEFSLIRQRTVATKFRTFDHTYARMKREAHDAVRRSENTRSDLMTELYALNNLQEAFQRPAWFGLDFNFDKNKGSDLQRLQSWFGFQSLPPAEVVKPPIVPTTWQRIQNLFGYEGAAGTQLPNKNEVEDASDSDGEDFDLDELQQNRLIEDIYMEAEKDDRTGVPQNVGKKLKYLHNDIKREAQQVVVRLQTQMRTVESLKDSTVFANHNDQIQKFKNKIQEQEQELNVLKKREDFMLAVLNAYKSKSILLPDIVPLVKNSFQFFTDQSHAPEKICMIGTKAERWAVFFYCLERAKVLTATLVKHANDELVAAQKELQEAFSYGDAQLIRRCCIVGMTTTGAAKYNDLLRAAKSKIVIVEEAAEVLESHIVTCLTTSCQHLILIGDHQQLRPSTTVYELSTQYKLDISLFERMVHNNLNCYKINVQHRMRPEIANLVVGTIYPELYNAPNVNSYPPILGVLSNLFFISHHEAESSESDTKSKTNEHEAKYVASLTRYLVQQGYTPDRITVLTTYLGQMFLIKKEMRNFKTCAGVRVTCVDNFQGEENDIIILSLVRSNEDGNIGFLKTDNRICVAISRAKHGMFIIGNMSKLAGKSQTWKKIQEKLVNRGEIGMSLTIECRIHGTINEVRDSTDFQKFAPEGGCLNPCGASLNGCTHKCNKVCHIDDPEHLKHNCQFDCQKTCVQGHPCKAKCFKSCPPCPVLVTKILPCEHQATLKCHIKEETVTCSIQVERVLRCTHKETMACFVDHTTYTCKVKVVKVLKCGIHSKEMQCHQEAGDVNCKAMVTKTLPCGHQQEATCWIDAESVQCDTEVTVTYPTCDHKEKMKCRVAKQPGLRCKSKCTIRLQECGHTCTMMCHPDDDPEHVHFVCKKQCGRICSTSGNDEHRCGVKHVCSAPCPACRKIMKRKLKCGHEMEMQCRESVEGTPCMSPCTKKLPCGHDCKNLCFEDCGPCQVPVMKKSAECIHSQMIPCSQYYSRDKCEFKMDPMNFSPCGHSVKVPCKVARIITPNEILKYCEDPCVFEFKKEDGGCGHVCRGSCSDCLHGRLHVKCQDECGRPQICGHRCTFPCSSSCPPCQQQCLLTCEHSKCTETCGTPCIQCTEPCTWRCEHKACTKLCYEPCDREPCDEPCPLPSSCGIDGHRCIGFCGEPCPKQCRICDHKELVVDFFLLGNEGDDDARFVLMEDCGHAIEHEGLEYYMTHDIEEGEVTAKTCPRCKTLIRKSRRFGDVIKLRLKDILQIKKENFGITKQNEKAPLVLVQRIQMNQKATVHFPNFVQFLLGSLCTIVSGRNGDPKIMLKKVDAQSLASFELMTNHLEEAVQQVTESSTNKRGASISLKKEYQENLESRFERLFDILMQRQIPLSTTEVEDFDHEFHRLCDLQQVFLQVSTLQYNVSQHPRGAPIFINLMRIIDNSCRRYDAQSSNAVKELLQELEKSLATGLGISDRERKEILQAINLRGGRWFKCPNGHYYIITECGGAMIESKCNECGAIIGGGNHRLRDDNQFGGEFDGAAQPLWPQ